MAKFRPGIPENFDIHIAPVTDLGDYLDEPSPMPQRKLRPDAKGGGEGGPGETPASPIHPLRIEAEPSTHESPTPAAQASEKSTPVAPSPSASPHPVSAEAAPILLREERGIPPVVDMPGRARELVVVEDSVPKTKAPRREISMTPEAFRMSEELLEVIRGGSGQRDTAAKELVHALILLAHEVVDEIDPHSIPKRGRWGTPTARAYPLELKNAIWKALLKKSGTSPNGPLDLD